MIYSYPQEEEHIKIYDTKKVTKEYSSKKVAHEAQSKAKHITQRSTLHNEAQSKAQDKSKTK